MIIYLRILVRFSTFGLYLVALADLYIDILARSLLFIPAELLLIYLKKKKKKKDFLSDLSFDLHACSFCLISQLCVCCFVFATLNKRAVIEKCFRVFSLYW